MSGRLINTSKKTRGLPLLGKLRIGIKAKTAQGKEYPKAVDYFVADGDKAYLFRRLFGIPDNNPKASGPKEITICFHSKDPKLTCEHRLEVRDSAGKLLGFGDGQNFIIYDNTGIGRPFTKLIPYPETKADMTPEEKENEAKFNSIGKWEEVLYLRFVIPEINTHMGYWELMTKATNSSIPNIVEVFDSVAANVSEDVFMRIPFILRVKQATSQRHGTARKYSVIDLIPTVLGTEIEKIQDYYRQGNKILGIIKPGSIPALIGEPKEKLLLPENVEATAVEYIEDVPQDSGSQPSGPKLPPAHQIQPPQNQAAIGPKLPPQLPKIGQ